MRAAKRRKVADAGGGEDDRCDDAEQRIASLDARGEDGDAENGPRNRWHVKDRADDGAGAAGFQNAARVAGIERAENLTLADQRMADRGGVAEDGCSSGKSDGHCHRATSRRSCVAGTAPALVLGALGGGGVRAGRLYSKRPDLITRIFWPSFLRHFWRARSGARSRRALRGGEDGRRAWPRTSANWLHCDLETKPASGGLFRLDAQALPRHQAAPRSSRQPDGRNLVS